MRTIGIVLMIISGALDIVSLFMVGSSSFESFKTVLIISSLAFFVGFLMAIFGRSSSGTTENTTNPSSDSFSERLSMIANNDNSKWCCKHCGQWNDNSLTICLNCGEKKAVKSTSKRNVTANEWICSKCGKINQNYVGTCGCGQTKQASIADKKASKNPSSALDELKKYKELLDMGAITQEEYDTKKKELLNL